MLRHWILGTVLVTMTTGCALAKETADRGSSPAADLTFDYLAIGEPGTIDQTVTITNAGDEAAVPTLSYVALDESGDVLDTVDVTTVFGSDRGRVLAPAAYEVFDILRFSGAGSDQVEDVRVVVDEVDTRSDAGTVDPEVTYVDADGADVEVAYSAAGVRVRNPGEQDYEVRLVGIRWNTPAAGRSQQAERVTDVGGPTQVGAGETADVSVPADLQGQVDSLKVYISAR